MYVLCWKSKKNRISKYNTEPHLWVRWCVCTADYWHATRVHCGLIQWSADCYPPLLPVMSPAATHNITHVTSLLHTTHHMSPACYTPHVTSSACYTPHVTFPACYTPYVTCHQLAIHHMSHVISLLHTTCHISLLATLHNNYIYVTCFLHHRESQATITWRLQHNHIILVIYCTYVRNMRLYAG